MADIINVATTGEKHGFFWNSVGGDRKYDADSMGKWLRKFFTTGVFNGDFQVIEKQGMAVSVTGGYANIKGKVLFADETTDLQITAANSTYSRIDTVVLTCDYIERTMYLEVITGQYSGDYPVATPLVRDNEKYQIELAEVNVSAGAIQITQADITDKRQDTTLCGYITGTVHEMDFSQFAAQFQSYYNQFKTHNKADFDEWFANIRTILSGDVAGNLQNEIDAIQENVEDMLDNFAYASNINYSNTSSGLTATKVQGAIDEVVTDIKNVSNSVTEVNSVLGNANTNISKLTSQLKIGSTDIYMDMKDGRYGINTSSARGADTFIPFRGTPTKLFTGISSGYHLIPEKYRDCSFFFVPTGISVSLSLTGDPAENTSANDGHAITVSYSNGYVAISGCQCSATVYGNTDCSAWASISGDLYAV